MEKADRMALIRGIYLARAGVMAYQAKPLKDRPRLVRNLIRSGAMNWPQPGTSKRVPAFLKEPDVKTVATLRIRRTKKVSPLTKIAAQWRHLERPRDF